MLKKSFTVREDSCFRIGKFAFKVLKIQTGEAIANIFSNDNVVQINRDTRLTLRKKDKTCRYCLMDDEDDDNFLISPCNCSGSMKYAHIDCLSQWISTKMKTKVTESFIHFSYYKFCELCKVKLPCCVLISKADNWRQNDESH